MFLIEISLVGEGTLGSSLTVTSAVSRATQAQRRKEEAQGTFGDSDMVYWSGNFVWSGMCFLVNLTLRKITLTGKFKMS